MLVVPRWAGQVAALTGLVLLALVPVANADLRSPRLTDACERDRQYDEYVFGPWRIEGCTEPATPQGDEVARRKFFGDIELNGMLVEGNSPLIVTTEETGGNDRLHTVHRDSGKLILDPLILGQRRRIVLYSGEIDLAITAPAPQGVNNELPGGQRCPDCVPIGSAVQSTVGTVDLPVSGVPALLGLRVRDQIRDAKVVSDNPGSMEFKPPTSLGEAASALLRNWEGKITIKTVDGVGMKVENLKFKVPGIELPPLGQFEDLVIRYSDDSDEWSGSIGLDLGEDLFALDLAMDVSASTGAPTRIEGEVDNLNIAVGNTGIFLQRVNALFDTNPLTMGVGAGATAGPEFAGVALIEMSGNLLMRLELNERSNFRLEVDGNTRVFPVGGTQLATGDMHIVIDSQGYISIGGDARYELLVAGVGIAANIGGSGAYATDRDRFNIEAHATGRLELGFLGGFDVVQLRAVVSSDGWGTCGSLPGLFFWAKAGVGQQWDRNPDVLLGCDLSPYDAPVADPGAAQDGSQTRTFTVRRGVKTLAVEATAAGPEPRARLVAPNGSVVATSVPLGVRRVGNRAAVVAQPGSPVQYFLVRNPAAGRWKLQWAPDAPQITGLRTARDMPPLKARVAVRRLKGRAGRRRLQVQKISGLARGEQLVVGVRTPAGVMPLGTTSGRGLRAAFDELPPGRHAIVGSVLRNGVPLPARTRVLGQYRAKLPPPPRKVRAKRRGRKVIAIAQHRRGAERPDQWLYVLRKGGRSLALKRARPGRPVRFRVPRRVRRLKVAVRGVVNGRPLGGKPKVTRVGRSAGGGSRRASHQTTN